MKSEKTLAAQFFEIAIPCVIALFLTSSIVFVDGLFIGRRIGEAGLAAVNMTLPVLYLALALAIMTGVGGLTVAMHRLGAGDEKGANARFTLTVLLTLGLVGLVCALVALLFPGVLDLLRAQGTMRPFVADYLGTMLPFYPLMMGSTVFVMFIRSEGKPQVSLLYCFVANLLNVLLDWLFLFRFDWGMRGAALASGISVIMPFCVGAWWFLAGKSRFRFAVPRVPLREVGFMLYNGSSEFVGQLSVTLTTWLANRILLERTGVSGVAAFTLVGYFAFVQSMFHTGLAQAMNPLVSYRFGAGDREGMQAVRRLANRAAACIGVVSLLIACLLGEPVLRLFLGKADGGSMPIAVEGLRLFSIGFLLNGYNMLASCWFTSIGRAGASLLVSSLRSLLLLGALLIVLPPVLGVTGVWLAAPIAEILTFAVALPMTRRRAEVSLQAVRAGG